ncbi:lysophospholipid acyltransferase family protein [Desulfurivibrio dismutans]|uniref:lysophospholipid acyltransferase family protein n=1 Tax=Desulfurivibrio dismutans TaxID=1398908 RepID=UPI0023DB6949|nr:lysophospholipid acyltransferase family protein [Desulfurivibrio alkaliphilus]MDF1613409.1 lysophospholipid acyltransferase family protein [Desulfurivibrio alkaliphilus]
MAIKNPFLHNLARRLAPSLYHLVSRGLFASCRVRTQGLEHLQDCLAQQPFISACWHYAVFFHLYQVKRQQLSLDPAARWVLMVSASDDAELLSGALRLMNAELVRGSRNRGGVAALKGMIAQVKNGANAGIIADGSQGPARIAQAGAVLLASRTGAPILPSAWAADRCWRLRSWDRTMIPKPLARISYHYGPPLAVPEGIRGEETEQYRLELEKRLNALYREAMTAVGQETGEQP